MPVIHSKTEGLVVIYDAANVKTYSGIGNTIYSFNNNNFGNLTNGVGFTSTNLGLFEFDGASSFIDTSFNTSIAYQNNFTIEFIAKPFASITTSSEATSGTPGISGKKYIIEPTNESGNGGLGIALGTNAIEIVEHGSGYLPVLLSYSANLSNYNHYAIAVSNRQASLYINGVFVRQGLQSLRSNTIIRNTASIGKGYYGYYNGQLLFYRLYGNTLSANEIKEHYQAINGRISYQPEIITSNLIMNIDAGSTLSYRKSGTEILDLSDNKNHATIVNSGSLSGTGKSSAISLDGTNSYIMSTVASLPTGNSPRTVSMWFFTNANSWGRNTRTLFEYGSNSTRLAFGIDMDFFPAMEVYTWNDDITWNTTFNQVGWKNITVVYDGNLTIRIFENGRFTQTKTLGGQLNTSNTSVYIGRSNLVNNYYNDKISSVQIYNKALTANEIMNNYRMLKGRFD